jgi:hypothetical protein
MTNIINFPRIYCKTPPNGFYINLYTDSEVDMTLFCINIWGTHPQKYIRENLRTLDPTFVRDTLKRGYESNLLSPEARKIINKIIRSMVPVHLTNQEVIQ